MAKRKAPPARKTPRKRAANVKNQVAEGDTMTPENNVTAGAGDTMTPEPVEIEREVTVTIRCVLRQTVGYQSYQAQHGANVQAHVNGRQYSALAAVFAGLGLPRIVAGREVGSKADAVRHIFDQIADQLDAGENDV